MEQNKNNKIVGHWLPNHRWGLDRRQNYYLWTGPVRDPNLERRTSTSANGNFWEPSRPRPIGAKDCSPDCSTRFAKLFKSPLAILPKLFPCALLIWISQNIRFSRNDCRDDAMNFLSETKLLDLRSLLILTIDLTAFMDPVFNNKLPVKTS